MHKNYIDVDQVDPEEKRRRIEEKAQAIENGDTVKLDPETIKGWNDPGQLTD